MLGHLRDDSSLIWLAVPIGLFTGAACAWGFGRTAHRRLRDRGPELLQLMRVGPRPPTATRPPAGSSAMAVARYRQALLSICVTTGMIAVVPQGIVPAVMKLTDTTEPVWFLALHAPAPWQWPIIIGMTLLGLALLFTAITLYRTAQSGGGDRSNDSNGSATTQRPRAS